MKRILSILTAVMLIIGCSQPRQYHDKPFVKSIGILAPNLISVIIQAGEMQPSEILAYKAQEGDSIAVNRGRHDIIHGSVLYRKGAPVGWLVGEKDQWLRKGQIFKGDTLNLLHADEPVNYTLDSMDDTAYQQGLAPESVYRKSKPNNWLEPQRIFCIEHRLYFKLPHPLKRGKTYTLNFGHLNVETQKKSFTYQPDQLVNEAIHVNQAGYLACDPGKRAYLSAWLGTGGAMDFENGLAFDVIHAESGKQVFTGQIKPGWHKSKAERIRNPKNLTLASVYHLDFGDFNTPGLYRISLRAYGVSPVFEISDDVYQKPVQTAMKGFYIMRGNIALGAPYTTYKRPRGYYPDEQLTIYESDVPLMNTGNGLNALGTDQGNFENLIAAKTSRVFHRGVGGYHDAGDWDRRIQHLYATRLQLELLELYPDFYESLDLNIPESDNALPDILDEALFNLDFYRQLQEEHGGVRGGIEAAAHPREGETSWMESLDVMVYSPGIWASYWYAGVAARASLLLQKYDASLAEIYQESALKAAAWAESQYSEWTQDQTVKRGRNQVTAQRNLAALELYRLTGNPHWHTVFMENTWLVNHEKKHRKGRQQQWMLTADDQDIYRPQRDAIFMYAMLNQEQVNPAYQAFARAIILYDARASLDYQRGNGFNLTTADPRLPLFVTYYSVPHSISLCRGHWLTKDEDMMAGIVLSTHFPLGANPMNLVYMSGINENSVKNLFHIDSRLTGQPLPAGLIPFGQFDHDEPMTKNQAHFNWPYTWFLGKVTTPDPLTWPINEAFYDIYRWPMITEWTPMQANGPNVYVWGYLAGMADQRE